MNAWCQKLLASVSDGVTVCDLKAHTACFDLSIETDPVESYHLETMSSWLSYPDLILFFRSKVHGTLAIITDGD